MGVQTVFVAERIITPQRFAERIDCNDLTFISDQSFQKHLLLGGQSNRFSILADLRSAENEIVLCIAVLKTLLFLVVGLWMAEHKRHE